MLCAGRHAPDQRRSPSGLSLVVRWSTSISPPAQIAQWFAAGAAPLTCAGRLAHHANLVYALVVR